MFSQLRLANIFYANAGKLGRAEAEQSYTEKLVPAIEVRHIHCDQMSVVSTVTPTEPTRSVSQGAYSYTLLLGNVSHHGEPDPFP